jgi:hypothetical protein
MRRGHATAERRTRGAPPIRRETPVSDTDLAYGRRMTNPSIRPAKLADAIAEHIQQMILEGSLRPGERLLPNANCP